MGNTATSVLSAPGAVEKLSALYDKYRGMPGNTIPVLQEVQEIFGYVPEEAVNWIADRLNIPRSKFYGVATFYSQFYHEPKGKNVITVCCGTACHVKGSEKIYAKAEAELGLEDGERTTEDMEFTLERVACLGTCSMAPAVVINKKVHGTVKADAVVKEIRHLKGL